MKIHLFGAKTPSGQALRHFSQVDLVGYSRNPLITSDWLHYADFNNPADFHPVGLAETPAVWISFAPIWLFSSFLDQLATDHPDRLQGLRGLIACSSSSAITKRFAVNSFDRQLVARLISSEDQLLTTCSRLSIPCRILRPTLIYGEAGGFSDRNLSRLLQLMRDLPFLPLPANSGLRQPIHVTQLAAVALHLVHQLAGSSLDPSLPFRIALGGDTTLTYAEMISALQQAQPSDDPARRCRLCLIPNRLFYLLAAPLLLRSPKSFEAVLRMGADLSSFTPVHRMLGSEPQAFPVTPLA